jgi:hydrogenase maturation protease
MTDGTVIIGMGNPLLTDDGVGIAVARSVADQSGAGQFTVVELHTGGIRLMEAMRGFRRAVVVDAMLTGAEPGTVCRFNPERLVTTKNCYSSHDTDFASAFTMGELLGIALPEQVSIWGIEACECSLFGLKLSPSVAAAVPRAVAMIIAELRDNEVPL